MANLANNLVTTAERHPDGPAVRLDDTTLNWAQLESMTRRLAGFLAAQGIKPGDRVALSLPNVVPFPVIAYGILRLGAIMVPMNPLLTAREVEYHLRDAGVSLAFGVLESTADGAKAADVNYIAVDAAFMGSLGEYDAVDTVADADDSDTAVILYTSGTTGKPKGAQLTHGSLNRNQEVAARTLLQLTHDDVVMGCLPLFHVFGLTCALNASVSTGALLTLIPRFDPRAVINIMNRDNVTVFMGVPTMYQALLNVADHDPSVAFDSLRTCVSGGSSMPVEVLKRFEEHFDATILEGYGLSETSPVASFNHPNAERKPGSIGTPIEGVEMMLIDENGQRVSGDAVGEIVIRGHNLMTGYWQDPDATAQAIRDGWFHSGDLAHVDADGFYFIVDRAKDVIIRAGYNVYPREVEEALYEHHDIVECAVIGIPDSHNGEEIAAYVVRDSDSSLTEDQVRDFAKEHVAAYKYPRRVFFVDELPKGATGKILKRELKARHAE